MVKEYKELLITNELLTARKAKAEGRLVILSYPLAVSHGSGMDTAAAYGGSSHSNKFTSKEVTGAAMAGEHAAGVNAMDELSFSDFPYAIENAEELDETYLDKIICRMKGIPCHIADTGRCRIREITVADVEELYRIYDEPGITDYMEPLYEKKEDEIAYTRDYIRYQYGFYDFGMWIIEEKETGRIIGRAGFDMRQGYEEPEMGYLIRKEYQRRGYATEVCRALLDYGREEMGFTTVRAFTSPGNQASVKLLEELGFVFMEETIVSSPQKQRKDKVYAHYIYRYR